MAEHQHGTMDISTHQATFAGFIKFGIWTGTISILVLIFLALANA